MSSVHLRRLLLCASVSVGANVLLSPADAAAYELTPHCRSFFGTWPGEPMVGEEMIRLEIEYDRYNPNMDIFSLWLLPPNYWGHRFNVIGGTYGTPSKDLRLSFEWSAAFPSWPNAASEVTYEILEDHFVGMNQKLSMKFYVGEKFMWIESIADGEPNKVVTSPIFFGLGAPGLAGLATAIQSYESTPGLWAYGIVTGVSRCRYPIKGRFEDVIDAEYAKNESPTADSSIRHKASAAWGLLNE